jgi:hypothetical protein
MSKVDEVLVQLELLADFQDTAIRTRIERAPAEKFQSGPYPEGTETVHRLKITLRKVRPPVWRRIEVASDTTLGELSAMLEGVMGWYGGHLHAFDVDGTKYGTPNPDWPSDDLDENKYLLGAVLPTVGRKMGWDYDFGDNWQHAVLVEAIIPSDPKLDYPRCITGKRACPPDDCGGPWGYSAILEALRDPNYPDREDLLSMAPPHFNPGAFNCEGAEFALRAPRPMEGW